MLCQYLKWKIRRIASLTATLYRCVSTAFRSLTEAPYVSTHTHTHRHNLNLLCPAHTQRTRSANRKCTRAHRRLHSRTSQTNCTFTPDRPRVAAAQPANVSACAPELQNERRHSRVHTHMHICTLIHTQQIFYREFFIMDYS